MGNFCTKAPRTENGDLDHGQKAEIGIPSQDFQSNAAVSTDHVQNAVEPSLPPSLAINFSFSRNTFVREELERATNGFSDANFLGKGGFGTVHKGVLGDGRRVAIKQLIVGSRQGDHEFQSEVEIISRVHHRHLVTLVGWCIADGERMLVYEFVPNNTLKFHLHENKELTMDWPTRMKIALGSAKGLAYLHEDCNPKIIHRDIKSDNILLNHNYDAKIADFGLARIFPDDQTHVDVSKIAGTFGYVDPQYASTGELTDKSDVYSFGVILLELVTGFQSLFKTIGRSRNSLVAWAWPLLEDHNFDGLVDTRLQKNYNAEELTRILECAAACVRVSSRSRPRMSEVLRVLEGHSPVGILREEDVYSRNASYKPNGRSPLQMPAVPEHDTNNSTSSVAFFSTNSNQEQSRGNEPSSRQGLQASRVIGMKMVTV